MAFVCPVNEEASYSFNDGTCQGEHCRGNYFYITGRDDTGEIHLGYIYSCHYPIELKRTASAVPAPFAQWDAETFSVDCWNSRYNNETYKATCGTDDQFELTTYNGCPCVGMKTNGSEINDIGEYATFYNPDPSQITIPQHTTIIAMVTVPNLIQSYSDPDTYLPTWNLDSGAGYGLFSGQYKWYWKFGTPPYSSALDWWVEIHQGNEYIPYVYYGYTQSRSDYIWFCSYYGGKALIFEASMFDGYLSLSQLMGYLSALKIKFPALADVVWYNGADVAPAFPYIAEEGEEEEKILVPNLRTSSRMGINTVRADVPWNVSGSGFRQYKSKTRFSLGSVQIQPTREWKK